MKTEKNLQISKKVGPESTQDKKGIYWDSRKQQKTKNSKALILEELALVRSQVVHVCILTVSLAAWLMLISTLV